MVPQVKIRTGVDTFQFFEPEREPEFYIRGRICIVSQFFMIVKTIVFFSHSQRKMPFQPVFLPGFVPFLLLTRANKKLHFHLFEFPLAENKLARYDLVPESLSGLCYTERNFHPSGLLDIEKVDKNSLCGLRTKVQVHGTVCRGTQF